MLAARAIDNASGAWVRAWAEDAVDEFRSRSIVSVFMDTLRTEESGEVREDANSEKTDALTSISSNSTTFPTLFSNSLNDATKVRSSAYLSIILPVVTVFESTNLEKSNPGKWA